MDVLSVVPGSWIEEGSKRVHVGGCTEVKLHLDTDTDSSSKTGHHKHLRAGKVKASQGGSHGPAGGAGGLTGQQQSKGSTECLHVETHKTDKNSCTVGKKRQELSGPRCRHIHMTAAATRGGVTHARSRLPAAAAAAALRWCSW